MPETAKSPVRRDPPVRPVSRANARWDSVRDKRPGYQYVLAFRGDPDTGFDKYLALGWEPVKYGDGESLGGRQGRKGDFVTYYDHVLMRLPIEDFRRIEREGESGDSGQQYWDWLESKLIERRGEDKLRGMHRGLSVINEIEAPEASVVTEI